MVTGGGDSLVGPAEGVHFHMHCTSYAPAIRATPELLRGASISPGSLKWTARPLRKANGDAVDAPTALAVHELPPGAAHWSWGGIEVWVDTATPEVVRYSKEESSRASLEVQATATTDLGETPKDSAVVPNTRLDCVSTGGTDDFFEAIIKGLAAIQKLQGLGAKIPPRLGDPAQIDPLVGLVGSLTWPKNQLVATLPEPYDFLKKVTGETRDTLRAFYRLVGGVPPTKEESALLVELASFGARLTWTSPPPKGAFDLRRRPPAKPPLVL
jgi:hypothetical protein